MVEREVIENWLRADEYECEVLDPAPGEKVGWKVVTRFPRKKGNRISLAGAGQRGDILEFLARVDVSDGHRAALAKLPDPQRREMRYSLVRDFLLAGVQYALELDETNMSIVGITIAGQLREDGLTRQSFFKALQDVNNGMLLGILHIRRSVGAD